MPLLIDTETRTGVLVQAINDVLVVDGIPGLTLRTIGRQSGVSPSSMLHHYGSREHLLRVAAWWTARARLSDIRVRSHAEGVLAFLPHRSDDVLDARAWLAWKELWRSEETLTSTIDEAVAEERAWMARLSGYGCGPDELDRITAVVDGLLVALCRPARPMRVTQAREILRRSSRGLFPVLGEEYTDPGLTDVALVSRIVRERRASA